MIFPPTALGAPSSSSSAASPIRLLTGMNVWVLWVVLAVVTTLLGYLYADSLRFLAQTWLEDDNYSHCLLYTSPSPRD